MNKELTEKYTYGLDHKGQGDLAYQQLDIEYGDFNEMTRARQEFQDLQAGMQLLDPDIKNRMDELQKNIQDKTTTKRQRKRDIYT